MINKKLAIGSFLTASLVAQELVNQSLEPTIAASNDVMAAFLVDPLWPKPLLIIGSPVTPLVWMWTTEITSLRYTETLKTCSVDALKSDWHSAWQNAAHRHHLSSSTTSKAI